jgi:type I restriction enzyme R subunit
MAFMEATDMKSTNFEMLREKSPELADLGGFAEQYAYQDPSSCLVKLRSFAERMLARIYAEANLPRPFQPNLLDLLRNDAFRSMTPPVVLDKFHSIRIHGNKAAHGEEQTKEKSLWLLKEAFDLGCWFHIAIQNGSISDCNAYQEPAPAATEGTSQITGSSRRALLQKLADQEVRLQGLLKELETRQAAVGAPRVAGQGRDAIAHAGKHAADTLDFDEETTRKRLIDAMLVEAGWNVESGGAGASVSREEEVPGQPTETGIGYADYVLKDDNGKPLAVIEAKKTAVDANIGRKQAQLYAEGLEKKYGQRPVILYTNGYELWIWDDAQNYPPRLIQGFYSKDSLQYLVFQRRTKSVLDTLTPKSDIVDRLYQIEAIKRVCDRFRDGHRKTLVVQATGTGKTRVAIALTDLLIRAGWIKRVLFLCDRKELRKQAKNTFTDFINEPLTIVRASTAKDRTKRIYLSTYPAMMKIFETFDTGFFDLIIADESHRSIYNRYRDLFVYFDCLQIGLTATPVDYIARNTYRLFDCQDRHPTAYYPLSRAVEEEYLVPYEVYTHTTNFLRSGIKYSQLTDEQRQQLEDDGEDPETFDYEAAEVDRQVFNKDTNRAILRNLMENGLRETTGQHPGKSIIFARNHKHAVLLCELFDEMYPQYGGSFCQVIDNYDPRAEQLIDDFKGDGNNKALTIAISVDMLDTGIDIPEIVNLVFAKPVKSRVKFWQMIGRGTRLCRDLYGPGKDKTKFRIFDHWGNFEYFEEGKPEAGPIVTKSLMQRLFEARVELAELALNKHEIEIHEQAALLIAQDLNSLPERTIAVRERWKEKRTVSRPEVLVQFTPATVAVLRNDMAPLMQWVNLIGPIDAYSFDLLITQMQIEALKGSSRFADLKDKFLNWVNELLPHLNPVREKADILKTVKSQSFWDAVDVAKLERLRKELRGIMHHRQRKMTSTLPPKVVDVEDGEVQLLRRAANVREIDVSVYKKQVEEALRNLFDTNLTLQKIRSGGTVTEDDLKALCSLVLLQYPGVDLELLKELYGESAVSLEAIIRSIVGMEPELVKKHFLTFVQRYPGLTADQTLFLNLLQNHISKYGSIGIERLYEPPFTSINSNGLDGVFSDEQQISELLTIINGFQLEAIQEETPT